MKIGIIDLGTNTFHLLIADIATNGTWKKIHQRRITVKIGQGGIHKNIITEKAIIRGLKAVAKFTKIIKEYNVRNVYAYGTAAIRSAQNGKQFLNKIYDISGIRVKIITGDKEAEFIFRGVSRAVDLRSENALIMDIGGGSVEFIITCSNKICWKQSLKLGAAYILEHFNPSDPVTSTEIRKIRRYIKSQISDLLINCIKYKPVKLIGSAGSFETFASMIRYRFRDSGTHYGKTSHAIAVSHFISLYNELLTSTKEGRNSMKGLIKMRVDMIVPAAILLKLILEETKIKHMQLSAYALKEGALITAINSKHV